MTNNRAPSKIIPRAFPGIKPNEIEELIAFSQVRAYPPGAILCRENAVEDRFYMILEGEVEVSKVINNSQNRLLKTLDAGDFFGEMALIHNAPRAATVTAKTALTTLELDKAAFNHVLRQALIRSLERLLPAQDLTILGANVRRRMTGASGHTAARRKLVVEP